MKHQLHCITSEKSGSQFPVTPLWTKGSGLHEAMPADSLHSCCPDLSPCRPQYFSFLLYHLVAPSRSSSSILSMGVPIQSLFLYGRGILPSGMSDLLPFMQFDLHCHWLLLCTSAQFFTIDNIRPKDFVNFPKYLSHPRRLELIQGHIHRFSSCPLLYLARPYWQYD